MSQKTAKLNNRRNRWGAMIETIKPGEAKTVMFKDRVVEIRCEEMDGIQGHRIDRIIVDKLDT